MSNANTMKPLDADAIVANAAPVAPLHTDLGLLLLRAAGLFLALTFGWQKVSGLLAVLHEGAPLSTSGLAPLIHAMGLPAPALLYVCAVLNESLGALFIAFGFLTRRSAAVGAFGMAVAFCISIRLGEDSLRALLYLIIFLGLAVAGPGRFSVDHALQSHAKGHS